MPLVIDANDWLEDGSLPAKTSRLRSAALRVARFIEYGAGLKRLEGRETLTECRQRRAGKACDGLMWITRRDDDRLAAFCTCCQRVEVVISGWEKTVWADGPMRPLPMIDD